jgi:hypothetical protein
MQSPFCQCKRTIVANQHYFPSSVVIRMPLLLALVDHNATASGLLKRLELLGPTSKQVSGDGVRYMGRLRPVGAYERGSLRGLPRLLVGVVAGEI